MIIKDFHSSTNGSNSRANVTSNSTCFFHCSCSCCSASSSSSASVGDCDCCSAVLLFVFSSSLLLLLLFDTEDAEGAILLLLRGRPVVGDATEDDTGRAMGKGNHSTFATVYPPPCSSNQVASPPPSPRMAYKSVRSPRMTYRRAVARICSSRIRRG